MRVTPIALVALLALACATPVGVTRVDDQTAHRALTGNVLSEGELSTFSKTQLLRLGLWETYEDAPDAALDALRAGSGGALRKLAALRAGGEEVRRILRLHLEAD